MKRSILMGSIALFASAHFFMKADTAAETGSGTQPPAEPVAPVYPLATPNPVVETTQIPIKSLVLDAGTQPRVAIDDETVKEYTDVIKNAIKAEQPIPFPAISVYRDATGRCVPSDGFHRIAAHKAAGVKEILCDIHEGDDRRALAFALGANAQHGVKRTQKDKQRALKIIFADPEWTRLTNSEIARMAAVSEFTVRDHRPAKSAATTRTVTIRGKKTTMNVSAIGKGKGGGKKGAKAAAKSKGKKGAASTAPTTPPVDAAQELDKLLVKIATAVGGTEGGKIRAGVNDGSLSISAREVRDWAGFDAKMIKRVAPLVTGGARMKPTKAFDFLTSELSEKVLTELHNRAIGDGGKFEFENDSVKVVVTHKGK